MGDIHYSDAQSISACATIASNEPTNLRAKRNVV